MEEKNKFSSKKEPIRPKTQTEINKEHQERLSELIDVEPQYFNIHQVADYLTGFYHKSKSVHNARKQAFEREIEAMKASSLYYDSQLKELEFQEKFQDWPLKRKIEILQKEKSAAISALNLILDTISDMETGKLTLARKFQKNIISSVMFEIQQIEESSEKEITELLQANLKIKKDEKNNNTDEHQEA